MNFKKIILTVNMLPLLVACNTSSISGVYGFQMGKEAGTHFGLYLNLTDKNYTSETVTDPNFKQFTASLSMKVGAQDYENSELDSILAIFIDESGMASIPGYYKLLKETNTHGEELIEFGLEFGYIVEKIDAVYREEQEGEPLPEEVINTMNQLNDSKIFRRLVYASYKDNVVNFYIPVSIEDALFQLYWYGTDIQLYYEDPNDPETLTFQVEDVTAHDYGTLPTADEIAVINQTFNKTHNAFSMFDGMEFFKSTIHLNMSEYRVFHQLKLGLNKK